MLNLNEYKRVNKHMIQCLATGVWKTKEEIHAILWTKALYEMNEVSYHNLKKQDDKTMLHIFWKQKEGYNVKRKKRVGYWSIMS